MSSTAGVGSMLWGYNADTHITDWLEAEGFAFDVATDEDLHAEGAPLLHDYTVVLTGTHPEYYSAAMRDAMAAYTARGGRLMYMGGNGFYWRIAWHPTLPGVIEVRRAEDGTRAWIARPGEYYHSFTGEYGGLWRRQGQGRAPQQLVGTGFIAQGFDLSSGFVRTPASHDERIAWAFDGIGPDEVIGGFGLIGGGAAGMEVDIADPALGTPPHTLIVATSEELTDTYLLVNEDQPIATPDTIGTANPRIRADITFFETPGGGAVFSFSSIAWAGSLSHNNYDNNVSRLTGNVLRRFAQDGPYSPPRHKDTKKNS
jgi:N,N-dimethylformamidase